MNRRICHQLLTLLALPIALWANANTTEITPPVGPIPGHCVDVIIDAEFLWWYSSVTDQSYAIKGKTIATGDQVNPNQVAVWVPSNKEEFDWEWDPGARLGIGVVTNHDGWDIYSEWTYFYNSLKNRLNVAPFDDSNLAVAGPYPIGTQAFTSTWFLNPNAEFLNHIKARWALLFNQIDLKLGRKYWISRFLSLHPFAGIRGYWARMHFSLHGSRPLAPNATYFNAGSTYRQKSWAVGLLTGLNAAWHLTRNWSIFNDAAVALTYGKYWIRRKSSQFEVDQTGAVVGNLSALTRDTIYQTQPFIDLALGLRWEQTFNQTIHVLFDIGWENHFLIDFNHLFRGAEPSVSFTDLPSTKGDLTLSGVTVSGRVEF